MREGVQKRKEERWTEEEVQRRELEFRWARRERR